MNILMVASEVAPFAKTGGLADVAASLPKELGRRGHNLRIVFPYYRMVKRGNFKVQPLKERLEVNIWDKVAVGEILTTRLGKDITVWLIKNDDYYDREGLYGSKKGDYGDNAERFIFFCKATLGLLKIVGFRPDIIHCHDWQTGLIPTYLRILYRDDPFFSKTKTVFTIDNLAYQGLFPKEDMPLTGLGWEVFTPEGIEFYGKINLLKAGIIHSDIVTTVSRKYAKEIQTPEYGFGLEEVLRTRREDLYGILNGADYSEWDPERDRFIKKNYGKSDLSGKRECKASLLKEIGLESKDHTPLFGLVSRLVEQKGIDLIVDACNEISRPGVLVILGKGEERYENLAASLEDKYPHKVGVKIAFDERLAHRIIAGCDFFLIPSRYEPCGLNGVYSLKYATIPIVRATGGLDDIVTAFDTKTGNGNGFKFYDFSKEAFLSSIREAIWVYNETKLWGKLVENTLRCNYSWEKPAREYEELYLRALARNPEPKNQA